MNDIDRTISNLQWASIALGEMQTETISQDRAISIAQDCIADRIDRLNPQPLTLEELRKMEGEPVYVVFDGTEKPVSASHWYLFVGVLGKQVQINGFVEPWRVDATNCGKTWLAYRRKPERSEGE